MSSSGSSSASGSWSVSVKKWSVSLPLAYNIGVLLNHRQWVVMCQPYHVSGYFTTGKPIWAAEGSIIYQHIQELFLVRGQFAATHRGSWLYELQHASNVCHDSIASSFGFDYKIIILYVSSWQSITCSSKIAPTPSRLHSPFPLRGNYGAAFPPLIKFPSCSRHQSVCTWQRHFNLGHLIANWCTGDNYKMMSSWALISYPDTPLQRGNCVNSKNASKILSLHRIWRHA